MTQRTVRFGSLELTVDGKEFNIGDKAPDFKAVDNDLGQYSFYAEEGDKIKIISAVPSLDTSVCELQTYLLYKQADDHKDDISVITISNDLPFAQKRFINEKEMENVKFVSDYINHEFSKAYSTYINELSLINRAIFVIDRDNIIRYAEYLKQNTELPNIDKAIEVAQSLVDKEQE